MTVQTLWLALEEAMTAGVEFPNVVFIYNAADHPACHVNIPCEWAPLGTTQGQRFTVLDL